MKTTICHDTMIDEQKGVLQCDSPIPHGEYHYDERHKTWWRSVVYAFDADGGLHPAWHPSHREIL